MSVARIESALIAAYEGAGLGLPTAYENRGYEPSIDTPWAAVYIIPNQPVVVTVGTGGEDHHAGIMQIDLYYPEGNGKGAVLAMSDTIRDVFEAGVDLVYDGQVVTIRASGRSHAQNERGMYRVIMTIDWYARTNRKQGV